MDSLKFVVFSALLTFTIFEVVTCFSSNGGVCTLDTPSSTTPAVTNNGSIANGTAPSILCDISKDLVCREGHCGCRDPVNQIWAPWYKTVRISKRTAMGHGSAGHGSSGHGSSGHGHSGGGGHSTGHYNNPPPVVYKTTSTESCYIKVGGECHLVYLDDLVPVTAENITTTSANSTTKTSEKSVNSNIVQKNVSTTDASGNSTKATPENVKSPVTVAAVPKIDVYHPKCVQGAYCRAKNVNVTATLGQIAKVGECVCREGYKNKSETDICHSGVDVMSKISVVIIIISVGLPHVWIRE